MATEGTPLVPLAGVEDAPRAAVPRPWRMRLRLSSWAGGAEDFLARAALDRGPWLAVAFAAGIAAWFALAQPWQWVAAIGCAAFFAVAIVQWGRDHADRSALVLAAVSLAVAFALGFALVWARSATVGVEPIERPRVMALDGRVLEREGQPAEDRVRIVLAVRDAERARAIKVRVNVPLGKDAPGLAEGARVQLRARLLPPAPPIFPGAYDFARAAWFDGLSATGSLVGPVRIVEGGEGKAKPLRRAQRSLSEHVRERLDGQPGAIAAAFASGDRGAIAMPVEKAMRDSGLTHLLSISGLHVSAVIAAAWLITLRLLALWPWLVLRVRLPLVAGAIAAGTGIAYTLLTGAEVPTVRSCLGALLVLSALALGREPLSMRMVAIVAVLVLAVWPEALVGPSFQMSFTAVIAIVALHEAGPVRCFLAPREEAWPRRVARRFMVLFVTGVVIEIALTPIVLFHFHRAGLYGAFANVLAIPLVTFASMPLIALALLFDSVGLGAPFWWLAGHSLQFLIDLAEWTAAQPGSVRMVPQIGLAPVLLYVFGGLWFALWQSRIRLLGLLPAGFAALAMAASTAPDILVSRDGREIGIAGVDGRLLVLRADADSYVRENLLEIAGARLAPQGIDDAREARCSADFCSLVLPRGERRWVLLVARSRNRTDERELAAACERSDIVIAGRRLPLSCRPRWLKADRAFLDRDGGLAIDLTAMRIISVAQTQGAHGWWRPPEDRYRNQ